MQTVVEKKGLENGEGQLVTQVVPKRKQDANEMRDNLKDYINSKTGAVTWQISHVRNNGEKN